MNGASRSMSNQVYLGVFLEPKTPPRRPRDAPRDAQEPPKTHQNPSKIHTYVENVENQKNIENQ